MPPLPEASLFADPRIAQAKELLLSALNEKRKSISAIRPSDLSLKETYQELLTSFQQIRGSPLWFPYLGSGIGNGPFVELLDGSIKLDFISGIGVHYFGHSHPALMEASLEAALSDLVMQGNLQQNGDTLELIKLLTQAAKFPHCFLTTSGAMATENALKIAFQKNFPSHRIFSFERCFVGRTLALAQITDKPGFREGLPNIMHVDYIPYYNPLHPEESCTAAQLALKKQISRYPKAHAAMIFELVQGEGGFHTAPREFFLPLMELCKENGIAVFVDEIQTFGRTPELFAFHYLGLEEYVDICTIGKLSYVCATFFKEAYKPKLGLLSQTFTASTSAVKCSLALLKMLLNSNLYGSQGKIQAFHQVFKNNFEKIAERYPGILKGPFGIGAMVAFTPLNGDTALAQKIVHNLFDEGLLCFIAGSDPTRVRMLPPFPVMSEEHIHLATSLIESVLKRFLCIS